MEDNKELEYLAKDALNYSVKKKWRKKIEEIFWTSFMILLMSFFIGKIGLDIFKSKKNTSVLVSPQSRAKKIINKKEKIFLTMYSVEIQSKDILDDEKFRYIINDEHSKEYIRKIGNVYYIAMDFGIYGKEKALKTIDYLKKKKIITNAKLKEPLFQIER